MTQITWQISDSASGVNWDDWCTVCNDESDVSMDLRYLQAVETSMKAVCPMWYLVAYLPDGNPVACACVSKFSVDGLVLAGPLHSKAIQLVRKIFPGYLKFPVMFCGLPISIGCDSLRYAQEVDKTEVVVSLNREIEQLVSEHGGMVYVWKEFYDEDTKPLETLSGSGYLKADSLPMNIFPHDLSNFDEFCSQLRSHYRYKIKKSRKKFSKAGMRVEHITDPNHIQEIYTPAVHQLYLNVLQQAEHQLETLPREFFLDLVENLPGEVSLTAIFCEGKIVAIAWGVLVGDTYRNIFVGVDYAYNVKADLYFNMMMIDLDYGIRTGAKHVYVGQSADDFKSRLGCTQRPLSIFVKMRSKLFNRMMHLLAPLFFPPVKPAPSRDLFKQKELQELEPASL